ncbi:methionyl-tRNA formyltransferase [Desulfohalobium retbaense]|uniref:Formyl transferase domain protein n=1 Tax=Desulfohalobium retbaense (strain ATCC 49708 / DSM 5692 / JCM 16813 / HR100) TaxID=485915 RepID=C8WYZ6_DESRD|nr:formyltransferase family protein [Desulfohalobium retbaense]ACV67912.1 formyl transferase domain protein [Desulfohalobium retbaense DSM 5692]
MTHKNQFKMPRVAFLGTFHPAVPTFKALATKGWICIAVLPKEAGYKNDELLEAIHESEVPWTYEISDINEYRPNTILAANYPKIISKKYLQRYLCINTHWSLLPRWRGVHPTAWAIINGDEHVGLTVHFMEEEFDTGDVLAQRKIKISKDKSINDLHQELAEVQASCVLDVFNDYLKTGQWKTHSQDEAKATYVPQRKPEDGLINWEWPTSRIEGLVAALPLPKYPGAFTYFGNQKIVISKASAAECPVYYCTPGQVVRITKSGHAWIKTGDICLVVQEVLIEGERNTKNAAEVLRLGQKLGFNPQEEIVNLKQEIQDLQDQVAKLKQELK